MTSAMLGVSARTTACDERSFEAALEHASFVHLSDEISIVGIGCALEVEPTSAELILRSIKWDAGVDIGCAHRGPLVVGALGYSETHVAQLWIPSQIFGRDATGYWRTIVGGAEARSDRVALSRDAAKPCLQSRQAVPAEEAFVDAVTDAVSLIKAGELHKVVLARREVLEFDRAIDRGAVLANLRAQQPGCVVFAVQDFVGASPELLIRTRGDRFESAPIAGTAATTETVSLAASSKDLHEHEFVIAAMRETFARLGAEVDEIGTPVVEVLADVAHLITHISGRSSASALELARVLHPTPAVAGTPTDAALVVQREIEGFDRGIYAGPIGWTDASGDGEWMLALRSALLEGSRATLFTGAGIVAESDPDAEWAETESKLAPMRRALQI